MTPQPAHLTTLGRARLLSMGGHEALVSFLEETLIPDLLESGRDATAEDFAAACCAIRQLSKTASNQRDTISRLRARCD